MKKLIIFTLLTFWLVTINCQFPGALTELGFSRLDNNLAILVPDKNLRGTFQWQKSSDFQNWIDIDDNLTDNSLAILPEETAYYRLKIIEGNCLPVYTGTVKIYSHHTTYFEYQEDSISVLDLLAGGITIREIFDAGALVGLLKMSGVDSVELHNVGLIGTLTDYDNNSYKWVRIFDQVWMAENLRVTHYSDGTEIPLVTDDTEWINNSNGAYSFYNNDSPTNAKLFGALYNWYVTDSASNGNKNICPSGWHVPTDLEWKRLEELLIANYYSYDNTANENKIAKALVDSTGWKTSNADGAVGNADYPEKINTSGFSAIPGGYRLNSGSFLGMNNYGYWWSSTKPSSNHAVYLRLQYDDSSLYRNTFDKRIGFSIRCIKD